MADDRYLRQSERLVDKACDVFDRITNPAIAEALDCLSASLIALTNHVRAADPDHPAPSVTRRAGNDEGGVR